jgi:DNA-binding NarL/FixJ family response regulator
MTTAVIIDDDRDMRLLARIAVEEVGGLVVGEAETGEQGVALARRLAPGFATMDFHMPGIDGVEATRQIRSAGLATRVVAWSSDDDPKTADAFRAAGAAAVVSKRDLETLKDVMRAWCAE